MEEFTIFPTYPMSIPTFYNNKPHSARFLIHTIQQHGRSSLHILHTFIYIKSFVRKMSFVKNVAALAVAQRVTRQ